MVLVAGGTMVEPFGEGGPPEELELLDELLLDEPGPPPPPPPHAVIIIDNAATRQYPKTFGTDTLHSPRASSRYALCAFCLLLASGIALTNATHRSHRLIFINHESRHLERELKWTTLKAL
jgi:hypothetical protein